MIFLQGTKTSQIKDLTLTRVRVTQGLFSVQAYANVSSIGRGRVVTGTCPLVVTTTTAH